MKMHDNANDRQMSLFSSVDCMPGRKTPFVNVLFSSPPKSIGSLAPADLILDEHKFVVRSWQDVLRAVCEYVFKIKPTGIRHRLMDAEFLWIDRRGTGFTTPFELAPCLWIELGGSRDDLFRRATLLLQKCGSYLYGARVKCQVNAITSDDEPNKALSLIEKWDKQTGGAIGKFARLAFTHLLQNRILTDSELLTLGTAQGTYKELGVYLKKCPLISTTEFVDAAGFIRCWRNPIVAGTQKFYVNKEWYESSRKRLVEWLCRVLDRHPVRSTTTSDLIDKWNRETGGKIGKFAFLSLKHVVENCLLSKDEFAALCTTSGVKESLGISLAHSPLFGLREIIDSNGYRRSWTESVVVSGQPVYINQQWYETSRRHLLSWLNAVLTRNKHFEDMLSRQDNEVAHSTPDNECGTDEGAVDVFERQLDQWGKESL